MKISFDPRLTRRLLVITLIVANPSAQAFAQTVSPRDLAQASIEELMNVP